MATVGIAGMCEVLGKESADQIAVKLPFDEFGHCSTISITLM